MFLFTRNCFVTKLMGSRDSFTRKKIVSGHQHTFELFTLLPFKIDWISREALSSVFYGNLLCTVLNSKPNDFMPKLAHFLAILKILVQHSLGVIKKSRARLCFAHT